MLKRTPIRTCIGCGAEKPKRELIRIVRTPEGEYLLDTTGRKNGRGAYLCSSPECMEKAWKSRGLDRSFREKVPQEVYERLKKEISGLGQ